METTKLNAAEIRKGLINAELFIDGGMNVSEIMIRQYDKRKFRAF